MTELDAWNARMLAAGARLAAAKSRITELETQLAAGASSGEPSAIPEEPAAWAIIEDGAVVGLRIAKDDADYAAQAWSRPPLVAPLFLRSALSGGIPRSLSEEPAK